MGIVRPARWSRPVHELCALSGTYRSRVPDQSPPAAGVPARKTILRRRLAPSVSQGVAFRKAWRGSAAQAFRKAWRGSSRAGALSGSARRADALTSALSKTRLARVPIVRAKLVYARGATWRQSPRTLCATRANLSFGGASRRPSLPPSLSLPSHGMSIGSHGSIGSIGSNSNKSVAILAEAAHRNRRWRSPPGRKWHPHHSDGACVPLGHHRRTQIRGQLCQPVLEHLRSRGVVFPNFVL